MGEGDSLAAIAGAASPAELVAGGAPAEPFLFEPWAGCGCCARPVPIDAVADDIERVPYREAVRLAYDDPALHVLQAPVRASALPKGVEVQHGVWGCFAAKRICRVTMPVSRAAALDILVHRMQDWVGSFG